MEVSSGPKTNQKSNNVPVPIQRIMVIGAILAILIIIIGYFYVTWMLNFFLDGLSGMNAPSTQQTHISPSATSISTPNPTGNWKTYTDSNRQQISFNYPASWYIGAISGEGMGESSYYDISLSNYPYDDGPYMSRSYKNEDYVEFTTSIYTVNNQDLYDLLKNSKIGEAKQGYDALYIRENDSTSNGITFIRFKSTVNYKNQQISNPHKIGAAIKRNEKLYFLSLKANSQQALENNRKIFDQILSTFKFLDQAQTEKNIKFITQDYTKRQYSNDNPNDYIIIQNQALQKLNSLREEELTKMKCLNPFTDDLSDPYIIELDQKIVNQLKQDDKVHSYSQYCETENNQKLVVYQSFKVFNRNIHFAWIDDANMIRPITQINPHNSCYVMQLTKNNDLQIYCTPAHDPHGGGISEIYNINLNSGISKLIWSYAQPACAPEEYCD